MRIGFYELEAWEREYLAASPLGEEAPEYSSEPLPAAVSVLGELRKRSNRLSR